MKSWRSRIAAAAVAGAAAATLPLTAGSASAATNGDGFQLAGGTLTHEECQEWGREDLENGFIEFQCRWNPNTNLWDLWILADPHDGGVGR